MSDPFEGQLNNNPRDTSNVSPGDCTGCGRPLDLYNEFKYHEACTSETCCAFQRSKRDELKAENALLRRAIYLYERDVVPGYQNMRVRAGSNFTEPAEYADWKEVYEVVTPIALQVRADKAKK
jgi:hypothetical protein